jgi:hypothetical protein
VEGHRLEQRERQHALRHAARHVQRAGAAEGVADQVECFARLQLGGGGGDDRIHFVRQRVGVVCAGIGREGRGAVALQVDGMQR